MTAGLPVDTINPAGPPAGDSTTCLDVEFGGYTTAGVKAENQDAFAAHQPSLGVRNLKGVVACVADGVSCSQNAQFASQTGVTHFIEDYYSTPDTWPVRTAAARVLSALNSWLYHQGQQVNLRHDGLVTTFSGAILKSTTAHLFHVGDSRIYRFRRGSLEQLTRDHSHHQRGSKVFLTRALGMDSHLEVDYHQEEVQAGDVLMLTTDGVHAALSTAQLQGLLSGLTDNLPVQGEKDFRVSLEDRAKDIVTEALASGSDDNVSCLLVRVVKLPLEDIDEVHRKLTQLAIPPAMDVGMSLDGYRVLRVMHSGTRSHVYLVRHPEQSTLYVLKAPSENFAEDPQYLEGFIREQWVGQRVNHHGVMKIYPHPELSPFLYHLCEYIEGQNLRQWLYDNPQPSLERVRDITRGIIAAMRAFQRLSMVHRDLKPENIILDKNQQVRLIDFGTVQVSGLEEIASPLREEYPVGSVEYIAPEYLLGQRGGFQADIFSLGVIVYEMLTGKVPFKVSAHRLPKHLRDWQYRPAREQRTDVPIWVDVALKKATHPNAVNRHEALSEFLNDLCTPNESMARQYESAPLLERNPLRFWQIVAGILFAVMMVQWVLLLKN